MVTMPLPPATDPHPDETGPAVPLPLLAAGWLGGGAVALVGVGLIGRHLGASAYVAMTFLNAMVVLLAALAALVPRLRTAGLLLAWNGLGVALSLLAFGLFSVGALVALPVILIALGLSAWPREAGNSPISVPPTIALVGGCLLLPVAYGLTYVVGWLAGMAA